MGPQDAKRLGAAIRRHRIATGLSQNKLAELADQQLERRASDGEKQTLRNSTILRLEDGKIRAPRPDLITAIAHVLNVDAADYFALAAHRLQFRDRPERRASAGHRLMQQLGMSP